MPSARSTPKPAGKQKGTRELDFSSENSRHQGRQEMRLSWDNVTVPKVAALVIRYMNEPIAAAVVKCEQQVWEAPATRNNSAASSTPISPYAPSKVTAKHSIAAGRALSTADLGYRRRRDAIPAAPSPTAFSLNTTRNATAAVRLPHPHPRPGDRHDRKNAPSDQKRRG